MKTDDRLERYCKYCEKASCLSDPDRMLCRKNGVVSAAHVCRQFRYDPLKRQPKRLPLNREPETADFFLTIPEETENPGKPGMPEEDSVRIPEKCDPVPAEAENGRKKTDPDAGVPAEGKTAEKSRSASVSTVKIKTLEDEYVEVVPSDS